MVQTSPHTERKVTTMRLPTDLMKRLSRVAKSKRRSRNFLVEQILEEALDRLENKPSQQTETSVFG